jgi:hypothetical protein
MNTALSYKAFEDIVFVRVEQAQEMHPVLGYGFKAAESK